MRRFLISRSLLGILICFSFAPALTGAGFVSGPFQGSLAELQNRLKSQYAAIEEEIAQPPNYANYRGNSDSYSVAIREWQARLAGRFGDAAATVEEISNVDTANVDMWRERLETLRLYSQPISPPSQRTVFGAGEVKKKAKVLNAPAATYTNEARADDVKGEVRLRLVLAADGTVKNVFPIRSLHHGLTESAMAAARQIKFEPAIRNDVPVSQFATFVYDFRKKDATPYIPMTVF